MKKLICILCVLSVLFSVFLIGCNVEGQKIGAMLDNVTAAEVAEPKNNNEVKYDVVLVSFESEDKLKILKVVREIKSIELKEGKDLVESAPVTVISGVTKENAEKYKTQLETVGAVVEIREVE